MPSFWVTQLWPVLTVLCQAFARILSMSLSFSPCPSSHHAETEEQAAGPSCCDSLAGVTVSAGKERSAGRVDAVPFLCNSLVGAPHCWQLVSGPHIIMANGAFHLCTRWFLEQFSLVLVDSYYPNFLVHPSLACVTGLCRTQGMSRALCSWKFVVFWNCLWRRGLEGISESFVKQLLCNLNWVPVQILNCFLN